MQTRDEAPGASAPTRPPWRLVAALAALACIGAAATAAIDPERTTWLLAQLTLALVGFGLGLALGPRLGVRRLVAPSLGLATLASLLLMTPLGIDRFGALRHLDLGLAVEPSILWVLASHVSAVATALEPRRYLPWLTASLVGSLAAAVAMPEMSILPQVVAGLVVIAWLIGRRGLALVGLAAVGAALALSALVPYVRRRWIGFLDPDGHARGAGYDYRALGRLVRESVWVGSPEGPMPRTSSPAEDYWFAAAMWRLGRLPVLAWLIGLGAALWAAVRHVPGAGGRTDASLVAAATVAGMLAALAIHLGYNLGLLPVTAVGAPFGGASGSVTAVQLFGLGFALTARGVPVTRPRPPSGESP